MACGLVHHGLRTASGMTGAVAEKYLPPRTRISLVAEVMLKCASSVLGAVLYLTSVTPEQYHVAVALQHRWEAVGTSSALDAGMSSHKVVHQHGKVVRGN